MVESVIQIKSGITINVNVSAKKHNIWENDYIWDPVTWICENGKYLARLATIQCTCDEVLEETKNIAKFLMKKMQHVKQKNF